MSNSHEKPELPDDARQADAAHDEMQVEALLQSGYAAPDPSVEFQEALLRELSETYESLYPAGIARAVVGASEQEFSAAAAPQRRVGLRLAMTMATAASLLFAVSLWGNQNAYGWESMLRALENCGWVQATSESSGHTGWASAERGILAIRDGADVAFSNQSEQTSLQYVSSQRVVLQQTLPNQQSHAGPEQLIYQLLCGDSDRSEGSPASLSEFEVLSESWSRVPAEQDEPRAIDLTVKLRKSSSPSKVSVVVTRLDAETHLPMSSRLLSVNGQKPMGQTAAGKDAAVVRFSYPDEGPSSIYALGVPRETEVVAMLVGSSPDDRSSQGTAREPEAKLLASKTDQGKAESQTFEVDEYVTAPVTAEPAADEANKSGESSPVALIASANSPQKSSLNSVFDLSVEPLTQGSLIEQVNLQMAANWHAQGITPAEIADDTEFLRRVYLDLTGRVPMVSEVYEFLEDGREDRREQLVDGLLASRDHATHLATVWRKLLLPVGEDTSNYGGTVKFDSWLADRFEKNIPYDQIVRQLLLAEGRVSDSGPILFYATLKLNPEELAGKTARTFLGMRMECAQCHDHPFDEAISQEDFWGFAAHFAQISRPQGKMEMTSSVLRVRDNRRGDVMLPDSDEIVPPSLPYEVASAGVTKRKSRPDVETVKALSRRELLADWITSKQNGRFSRATVNRVWQHLFGRGLVEPVDDMRVDNPATCPDVLDALSLDFTVNNYDLRRLLRTLVLSDAYQLSSRAATDDPSQGLVFARMNIKSFSADQLYDCINVATQLKAPGRGVNRVGAIARFGNTSREAFIDKFRAPPGQRTDYHAGIPQALTLMHGYLVHGATDLTRSGLLKSLGAPFFTDEQRIETLFLSTLSRHPKSVELETMLSYLQAVESDAGRTQALGDILWALLNSAEFTFIH